MCNITVNPHSHPRNEVWLLSPFYRWENSVRLGVWTSILTPPHPFTVLPTCEPCYSPFGGRWTILQMWAGWVACEGMLEYSLPLLSLLLLPLAFWEGDWHGQPEARQLLPLHVPWESESQAGPTLLFSAGTSAKLLFYFCLELSESFTLAVITTG